MAKLTQTGSVLEYQEQFEALFERVSGFSPTFLLNCFLSELKPSIRYEVESLQPTSLTMAFRLAQLQERKLQLNRPPRLHSPFPPLLPTPSFLTKPPPPSLTTFPRPNTTPNTNPSPPKTAPTRPTHRLTQKEIQDKRQRGLCYYCDDKYTFGHKCKPSFNILLVDDDV